MYENENLFNGAILDENGVIINVLVFDNEDTMREFNALRLADGQGIGDKYMTPAEYKAFVDKNALQREVQNVVDEV